jgi:hypothetical protein
MDVKLCMEFSIDMYLTVQKKLEEVEQKKQQYNSESSKLASLLLMVDAKLVFLEDCEASMFKIQFPAFDYVSEDEEIRQIISKLKQHYKQFKTIKALQTCVKKRVKQELKEKFQKKEETDMLYAHLQKTKENLHTQIAALKHYATRVLNLHMCTLCKY